MRHVSAALYTFDHKLSSNTFFSAKDLKTKTLFTKSLAFERQQFSVFLSLASEETAVNSGFIHIKKEILFETIIHAKNINTYLDILPSVFEVLGHGRNDGHQPNRKCFSAHKTSSAILPVF